MKKLNQSSDSTVQELLAQVSQLKAELASLKNQFQAQVAGLPLSTSSSEPLSQSSKPQPRIDISRRNSLKRLGMALFGGAATITALSFAPTSEAKMVVNPAGSNNQVGILAVPPGNTPPTGTPGTTHGTFKYPLVGVADDQASGSSFSLSLLGGGVPYNSGNIGVTGFASGGDAKGVYGYSTGLTGQGVSGYTTGQQSSGVDGFATDSDSYGVRGGARGDGSCGVYGYYDGSNPPTGGGVNAGVFGSTFTAGCYAGYFEGPVNIDGATTITRELTASTSSSSGASITGTSTASSGGSMGVHGLSTSSGIGVSGSSTSGIGVLASCPSGIPLHINPRSSITSTGNKGDIYLDNSGNLFVYNGAGWKQVQYM